MLNHHKLILLFTSFLSPWIRIPNSDPDPEDPSIRIRFRIRKTAFYIQRMFFCFILSILT